jgi:ribosome-associated protein
VIVTADLTIPESELVWRFGPSSGPGGQHANRSNTRAEVSLDLGGSPSLTDEQRHTLVDRFGATITVGAEDERSQRRNRDLARRRLADRLREALHTDQPRQPTKPSRAARARRVDDKRRRGELKQQRRSPARDPGD